MNKVKIIEIFSVINNRLRDKNEFCTFKVFGGASMCLLFQSREAQDIDAVFTRNDSLAQILLDVTSELNLDYEWLDCSIVEYIPDEVDWEEVEELDELKNLKVKVVSPRCLLAMKCSSSRTQTDTDTEDIRYLIKYLKIISIEQVNEIIGEYYRREIGSVYQDIVTNILNTNF